MGPTMYIKLSNSMILEALFFFKVEPLNKELLRVKILDLNCQLNLSLRMEEDHLSTV